VGSAPQGPPPARGAALLDIIGVGWCFVALGLLQAQVGARLPAVKIAHGLDDATLSLYLSANDAGLLVLLPTVGAAIVRYGAAPIARLGGLLQCGALVSVGLASTPAQLGGALAAGGAAGGALDMAMNTAAAAVEKRHGAPLMSRFHALFSVGFGLGGAAAGAAAGAGLSPLQNFLGVACAVGLASALLSLLHAASGAAARGRRCHFGSKWQQDYCLNP
jgi:hypothetical protein